MRFGLSLSSLDGWAPLFFSDRGIYLCRFFSTIMQQLSAGNLRESEEGPDSDSDGDEEEGEEAEDVDSPAVPDLQASRATSGESMQRVHALLSEVMARPMNDVCADCSARRSSM